MVTLVLFLSLVLLSVTVSAEEKEAALLEKKEAGIKEASCGEIEKYLQDTLKAVRSSFSALAKTFDQERDSMQKALKESMDSLQNSIYALQNSMGFGDPCAVGNHSEIRDDRRSTTALWDENKAGVCDNDLVESWYRFFLNGQNAVMPTKCVEEKNCTTQMPVWLDLAEQTLPEVGKEIQASGCANYNGTCCHRSSPITLRNCGDFFVYKLGYLNPCDQAYCAEPQQ